MVFKERIDFILNCELEEKISTESTHDSWVMDLGCTYHMTPREDWFINLRPAEGSVILGDGKTCRIEGIGTVKFMLKDGSIKNIA